MVSMTVISLVANNLLTLTANLEVGNCGFYTRVFPFVFVPQEQDHHSSAVLLVLLVWREKKATVTSFRVVITNPSSEDI